jgi:hypothetical protein
MMLNAHKPLKKLDSDERIQENPRKSKPQNQAEEGRFGPKVLESKIFQIPEPRPAPSARGIGQARRARPASERMVLEHPGLGQRLTAGLEEGAQLDRIGPLDDEVELGAPMAVDAVGDGLDQLIRAEGSARR